MTAADIHTRCVRGDQTQRDTNIFFLPEDVIGIVQTKCQPQQRGYRPQRDVTLFPGKADAQHIRLALPLTFTHDTKVRNAACIGTRLRAGQCEARHFQTLGQSRQVIVFLRLGAVVQQQLRRPQ